jgi:hypothetical protein
MLANRGTRRNVRCEADWAMVSDMRGVGVAMGRGSRRPDVSSVDAWNTALLSADAVVYS